MPDTEGQRKLIELVQRQRYAPLARAVSLSEPAVRQHASGERLPKHKARKAYEALGIQFHDWDRPAACAAPVAPQPAEPAAQIAAIRAQVEEGGGRDVLLAALRRSSVLFEASSAWVPRDRIAILTTTLAAVRALIPLEPSLAPTACPTWPGLKAKLLGVAAMFSEQLAELPRLIEAFEDAAKPAVDAIDLREAIGAVLDAGAKLSKGEIADRERVALEGMRVAAGKLMSRLDGERGKALVDPRWSRFKAEVFPLVHKHTPAWDALVAVET